MRWSTSCRIRDWGSSPTRPPRRLPGASGSATCGPPCAVGSRRGGWSRSPRRAARRRSTGRARWITSVSRVIREDGSVGGEARLIGLFTTKTYSESARHIPIVRGKLNAITQWEDLIAGSHDYKAVVALFDGLPKDELFRRRPRSCGPRSWVCSASRDGAGAPVRPRGQRRPLGVGPRRAAPRPRLNAPAAAPGAAPDDPLGRPLGRPPPVVRRAIRPGIQFIVHVPEGEIPDFDAAALEAEVVAPPAPGTTASPSTGQASTGARGQGAGTPLQLPLPRYYKSAHAIYQARVRHSPHGAAGAGSRSWSASRTSATSASTLTRPSSTRPAARLR